MAHANGGGRFALQIRRQFPGEQVARVRRSFPTPRANDANGPWLGQHAPGLNVGVNFPMPRTNTMRGGSGAWAQIQQNPDLTPEEKRGMTSTRGSLNPDWEEWLMCTPIGWTDLDTPNHRLLWLHPTHDPAARTCAESACLPYIPRLTTRRKYRNARVKGIGNMQYPPTAFIMAAWGFAFLSAQKEHTS